MFNQQLVAERLEIIRAAVVRLKKIAKVSLEEFEDNEDLQDIAENRLRRALEALFDLGRHLAVKSGAGIPQDYRSIIVLLKDKGVFPTDYAEQIYGMAGYRNRLIHDYNKVTPAELHSILQTKLTDLERFCKYVAHYIVTYDK